MVLVVIAEALKEAGRGVAPFTQTPVVYPA